MTLEKRELQNPRIISCNLGPGNWNDELCAFVLDRRHYNITKILEFEPEGVLYSQGLYQVRGPDGIEYGVIVQTHLYMDERDNAGHRGFAIIGDLQGNPFSAKLQEEMFQRQGQEKLQEILERLDEISF